MEQAFNQMADQEEKQVEELTQEFQRRKMLLGALTHELKTPMTSIMDYADTLLHVKLETKQREKALEYIYRECRRLESLLLNLIDNAAKASQDGSVVMLTCSKGGKGDRYRKGDSERRSGQSDGSLLYGG